MARQFEIVQILSSNPRKRTAMVSARDASGQVFTKHLSGWNHVTGQGVSLDSRMITQVTSEMEAAILAAVDKVDIFTVCLAEGRALLTKGGLTPKDEALITQALTYNAERAETWREEVKALEAGLDEFTYENPLIATYSLAYNG